MLRKWQKINTTLLLALLTLCSCSSTKNLASEKTSQDSTRVEVRTQTIYVTDTLLVEIPAQTAERTTADSVSHLENDYATSEARINSDGTLYHTLATKAQKKPVEFLKPVEHNDSIVYRYVTKTETVKETVEVERNLSWWERTRIYGFYALLLLLLINYRKTIFSLARRIFS